ncbi:MAG: hypothetical protein R3B07_08655 [Polyangiaceae bacterium]
MLSERMAGEVGEARPEGRQTLGVSLAAAVVAGLIGGVSLLVAETDREAFAAATRNTGRWSLALFSALWLSWSVTKRVPALPGFAGFASAHVVHLGFIVSYLTPLGLWPAGSRLLGGMLGYALLVSFPLVYGFVSAKNRLRLSFVYFCYLWLVFVLTYLPRALGKLPIATTDPRWAWASLVWLGVLALCGLAGWLRRTSPQNP